MLVTALLTFVKLTAETELILAMTGFALGGMAFFGLAIALRVER